MIRYYKLFDLLNRRNMKKSDLRQILSSSTVAKLSKGEYISGEAIEKICLFLGCQPGDIMEITEEFEAENTKTGEKGKIIEKHILEPAYNDEPVTETYIQFTEKDNPILIDRDDWNNQ